jgi:hypothetical protein
MNGAVDAAAAKQGFVRRINDRIDGQDRDVAFDDVDFIPQVFSPGSHHLRAEIFS